MVVGMSESQKPAMLELLTKQGAFIVSLLFFLFFSFATFSYSVTDAGWFYSGESSTVQNSMGSVGAVLADVLSAFFGSLFYTFPILFLLAAIVCWRNVSHLAPITYTGLISAGSLLYLCFGSVLCYLHSIGHDALQYGHGGILGHFLGELLYPLLGYDGATLVSLAFVLLGITLITQLHWPSMLERVGKYSQRAVLSFIAIIPFNLSKNRVKVDDVVGSALPDNDLIEDVDDEYDTDYQDGDEFDEPAFVRKGKSKGLKGLFGKNSGIDDFPDTEDEADNLQMNDADSDLWNSPELTTDNTEFATGKRDETAALAVEATNQENTKTEPTFDSFDGITIDDDDVSFTDSLYVDEQSPKVANQDKDDILMAAQSPLSPENKPAVKTLSEAKQLEKIASQDTSTPSMKPAPVPYTLPDRDVLTPAQPKKGGYSEEELMELSALLELRLADFGVKAEVVEVNPGPVITRFEIQPAPGVKVSRITNLAKDLARSLSVMSVRVVEVIAGKSTIGIEIPNAIRDTVYFSEVINCDLYDNSNSALTLSLGHDISGEPVVVDLAKMPHVLVAGTTGSGKSVGVNAMIMSMLLKSTPEQVRMIMVDPKMLELSIYEGIPHLLTPVITDMKDAANGLRWSVDEMERRYKLMSKLGVRNVVGFNKKVKEAIDAGQPLEDPLWQPEHEARFSEEGVARTVPHLEPLPYIVIIVDEFADMMMIVGKKVEELIARIAQKARAAGIHLVLATQRPSVDVITGLIKANIPTRMAFQVSSKIDSRTILDQGGADQLLGQGDMLYLPAGLPTPIRVHGAFVSDEEVHAVVEEWKLRGEPDYINDVVTNPEDLMSSDGSEDKDALYDEAVKIVVETRKASISSIQRRLKIGYNRAANLVEAMEAAGLVSPMGANGQREVLIPE